MHFWNRKTFSACQVFILVFLTEILEYFMDWGWKILFFDWVVYYHLKKSFLALKFLKNLIFGILVNFTKKSHFGYPSYLIRFFIYHGIYLVSTSNIQYDNFFLITLLFENLSTKKMVKFVIVVYPQSYLFGEY